MIDKLRIMHLSDLHSHLPNRKWLESYDGYTIITGDLTEDGTEFEYNRMQARLSGLSFANTVSFVPGNHDYGLRGNVLNQESVKRFDAMSEALQGPAIVNSDKHPKLAKLDLRKNWTGHILLNSCTVDDYNHHHACGHFGDSQLSRLEHLLETSACANIIIAFHHHLFWDSTFARLKDSARFLAIVKKYTNKYKNVILMYGHAHVHKYHKNGNIHYLESGASWQIGKAHEVVVDKEGDVTIGEVKAKFWR